MAAYAATSKAVGFTDRPVGDRDLLIMDEPSSGLDPHGIREIQDPVFAEDQRGTVVFFSSHILQHVEEANGRRPRVRGGRSGFHHR